MKAEEGVTKTQLAKLTNISPCCVNGMIETNLIPNGLVCKKYSDKRSKLIMLTEKGNKVVKILKEIIQLMPDVME